MVFSTNPLGREFKLDKISEQGQEAAPLYMSLERLSKLLHIMNYSVDLASRDTIITGHSNPERAAN